MYLNAAGRVAGACCLLGVLTTPALPNRHSCKHPFLTRVPLVCLPPLCVYVCVCLAQGYMIGKKGMPGACILACNRCDVM